MSFRPFTSESYSEGDRPEAWRDVLRAAHRKDTTGGRVTMTHQLAGPLDVQALAGRQTMGYRNRHVQGDTRRDQVETYGGGAGYRLRQTMRLGVTWEVNRRSSVLDERRYVRRRVFASLTYGS